MHTAMDTPKKKQRRDLKRENQVLKKGIKQERKRFNDLCEHLKDKEVSQKEEDGGRGRGLSLSIFPAPEFGT